MDATANSLTVIERAKLENYEEIIENGLQVFVDVGRALTAIRDGKLYRDISGTFEDYCRERWDIDRIRAYQLIDAATVVENVNHGLQNNELPSNKRQCRPLAKLEPEEQIAAWQEVIETAPEGKVTAKHVAEVVARRQGEPVTATPKTDHFETVYDLLEAITATVGKLYSRCQADQMAVLSSRLIDLGNELKEKGVLTC